MSHFSRPVHHLLEYVSAQEEIPFPLVHSASSSPSLLPPVLFFGFIFIPRHTPWHPTQSTLPRYSLSVHLSPFLSLSLHFDIPSPSRLPLSLSFPFFFSRRSLLFPSSFSAILVFIAPMASPSWCTMHAIHAHACARSLSRKGWSHSLLLS